MELTSVQCTRNFATSALCGVYIQTGMYNMGEKEMPRFLFKQSSKHPMGRQSWNRGHLTGFISLFLAIRDAGYLNIDDTMLSQKAQFFFDVMNTLTLRIPSKGSVVPLTTYSLSPKNPYDSSC
jgi:hypothetical protein